MQISDGITDAATFRDVFFFSKPFGSYILYGYLTEVGFYINVRSGTDCIESLNSVHQTEKEVNVSFFSIYKIR